VFFWKTGKELPNGYLSAWHLSPFMHEGYIYLTVHQWMAVQKARFFGDKSAEEKLHETIDPEDISTIAAGIKGDGAKKWGSMMGKAAVDGSYLKFTASLQAPDLKAKLLETGDRTLVKASPCDRFSGIGYGESIALSKQQFWGGNIMGKALMEVRRRLVEEAQ
ncbi:hypothetical protein BKA93DRAFT_696666, partial [Sparassis latifolia]